MSKRSAAGHNDRVLGWDVLRGFCAFAVLGYHLLAWQGITQIHTLGTYGVYLFFVLSGASLAYAYGGELEAKRFSMRSFLLVRYARLAPLYLLLMLVVLPWWLQHGGATWVLVARTFANLAFVFGFHDPTDNALLVGGWSLGIEAIFYLLFPLIFAAADSRRAAFLLAVAVAIQTSWIALVFSAPGAYGGNITLYHQVPAFIAYFVGGVCLGTARRKGAPLQLPSRLGLALLVGGFVVLALLNPARAGDQLIGWRGVLLFLLCFLLVAIAGAMRVEWRGARRLAELLGDATYGLYLIHPVLFFGLTFEVLPRWGLPEPLHWSLGARWLLLLAIAAVSFTLALASERWFERPIRQKVRRRLRPGSRAGVGEASSGLAAAR